jgi:hypothetical protein
MSRLATAGPDTMSTGLGVGYPTEDEYIDSKIFYLPAETKGLSVHLIYANS